MVEVKVKDSEINRFWSELKKCKEKRILSVEGIDVLGLNVDGILVFLGDIEFVIRVFEEKNKNF